MKWNLEHGFIIRISTTGLVLSLIDQFMTEVHVYPLDFDKIQ